MSTDPLRSVPPIRLWQLLLLVNLALAVGLGIGYGAWGWRLAAVEKSLISALAAVDKAARERDACAAGGRSGEQLWEGRGVLRAAYPRLLLITHEDIDGALPARTTGFRLADTDMRVPFAAGAPVRFWLRGTSIDNAVVVRVEGW
jgi:hypothetical protein